MNIETLKQQAWKGDVEAAFVLRAIAREKNDKDLLVFLVGVRDYHKMVLKNRYDAWKTLLEEAYKIIYAGLASDSQKIPLIKYTRKVTGWGLKEAKAFVCDLTQPEAFPMTYDNKEAAEAVASELANMGARVLVRAYENILPQAEVEEDEEDMGYM